MGKGKSAAATLLEGGVEFGDEFRLILGAVLGLGIRVPVVVEFEVSAVAVGDEAVGIGSDGGRSASGGDGGVAGGGGVLELGKEGGAGYFHTAGVPQGHSRRSPLRFREKGGALA